MEGVLLQLAVCVGGRRLADGKLNHAHHLLTDGQLSDSQPNGQKILDTDLRKLWIEINKT